MLYLIGFQHFCGTQLLAIGPLTIPELGLLDTYFDELQALGALVMSTIGLVEALDIHARDDVHLMSLPQLIDGFAAHGQQLATLTEVVVPEGVPALTDDQKVGALEKFHVSGERLLVIARHMREALGLARSAT